MREAQTRKHIPAHFRDPLENEVIERRRIPEPNFSITEEPADDKRNN